MPLVERLCVVDPAIKLGGEVLGESNEGLDPKKDVGYEAEDCVGRDEVDPAMGDFVVFDYDQAGDQGVDCEVVEGGVCDGALVLLGGGMGWLQDENRLREEEEGTGVEERVGGEEHEWAHEDAGPDDGGEEDDAALRDDGGS